jgi:hypothetical protein
MYLGKEKIIPIIAITLLLIGIFSNIYTHTNKVHKATITINEQEYTIYQIFSIVDSKTIETDDGIKIGISLEDLTSKFKINCPSCNKYTIKGKDGYQQTVDFDVLKTGILTDSQRIYFPDTAQTLWVRDVIEIEVK